MSRGLRASAASVVLLIVVTLPLTGCTRTRYRLAADDEVGHLVLEKSNDPHWAFCDFTIEQDPRSRTYDPWNRDFPPMPPDDPASHQFMHYVDGMHHWPHWHMNGDLQQIENPYWTTYIPQYLERAPDGSFRITLEDAARLSIMHDPDYQTQLETMYLSALDVSTERFRFDVQYFGNSGTLFTNIGDDAPGGNSNTLTLANGVNVQKEFATAGQLIVGFANTIMYQFAGPNQSVATSLLNFSFVQPLLAGGGRIIALEQLTIAERQLLYNLKALVRYRQGNYTNVAIGELAVATLSRAGGFFGGTGLTGFTGTGSSGFGGVGDITGFARTSTVSSSGGGTGSASGFAGGGAGTVGGFIGLLQQLTQIRLSQETLNAESRTLALLEANLNAGLIDIAQVDQFRQNIETERANLLQARNNFNLSFDTFKGAQLGLPPSLDLSLDEGLIKKFQFVDPLLGDLLNRIADSIASFGLQPKEPTVDKLQQSFAEIEGLQKELKAHFGVIHTDLRRLETCVPDREKSMEEGERQQFAKDRQRLVESLTDLEGRFKIYADSMAQLRTNLSPQTRQATADRFVALLVDFSNIAAEASLIQARSRLEEISVEVIKLDPREALEISRANRLDWQNARASVVDTWRLIEFNANALKSTLNLNVAGTVATVNDRPFAFRGETGTLSAGVTFSPPFTRLVQRNSFRQQLIEYQQDRRGLVSFEDGIDRNLRQLLRDQNQLRINLEIQRRAVAIAIRRVDQTREVLNKPAQATAATGAPAAQLGPTAALNLLTALSDLRNTQNNFISVWINFHADRMRLLRELGLMQVSPDGVWVEESIEHAIRRTAEEEPIPPAIRGEWERELVPPASNESPGITTPPPPPAAPKGPAPVMPPIPAPPAAEAAFHSDDAFGRASAIPTDVTGGTLRGLKD